MIDYEDFWLTIEPSQADGLFPVLVVKSPAGEGRSYFQVPFTPDEFDAILASAHHPDHEQCTTIGTQLFEALFTGPVRSLFEQSMGRVRGRDQGLRIRLHIDPEDPNVAHLAGLPWEYLYRQETREFLNLSRYTPLVRHLNVQRPHAPQPLPAPLRILVVIASPNDYDVLDLERERYIIESNWGKEADVQVDFLERATIPALQDRLSSHKYHVLHFMGHGDFDRESGRGALLMEDDRRRAVPLDGPSLATLLRDAPTLRLIFLNACDTATVTREDGLDPFTGVAAAIIMAGIPNAVAMQYPISDVAATAFARRFYACVAQGYPVDAAAAEGRKAIGLVSAVSSEWGTPVLFIRSTDDLTLLPQPTEPASLSASPPERELALSAPLPASVESGVASKRKRASGAVLGLALGAVVLVAVIGLAFMQNWSRNLAELVSVPEPASVLTGASAYGMARVPADTYRIGQAAGGTLFVAAQEEETAEFWIDKYEATNREYAQFVEATGSPAPIGWSGGQYLPEQAEFPVSGITWDQANAFCTWQKKRLPSEVEWEVAARGPHARIYSWGDEPLAYAFYTEPHAVGASLVDQSYFGVFDMVHNVQEWVGEAYTTTPAVGTSTQLLRGGSYVTPADLTQRFPISDVDSMSLQAAGVRCAADTDAIDASTVDAEALIYDDFSDSATGWRIGPDTNPGYHAPDWYHLEAPTDEAELIMLGLDNDGNLGDISVQSELFYSKEQTAPQAQFRYGLVVRQSGERYYAFVINARTQSWSVLKHSSSGMAELAQGINKGIVTLEADAGRNLLRVDASGSTFAFAINGHLATYFTDPDLEANLVGAIGFYVETLNGQRSHIHVENVRVEHLSSNAIGGPASPDIVVDLPDHEPAISSAVPSSIGMVYIDAGSYPVGADGAKQESGAFWIDRYEVTNAQFVEFVQAVGHPAPSAWVDGDSPPALARHPVRAVNWDSANAYCRWAQKRLPTEMEWEIAARGPFGWSYPWGEDGYAVDAGQLGGVHPVGGLLIDRSYFGVYDLGRNLWEWVDEPFSSVPPGHRVLRGGSYSLAKEMTEYVAGDPDSGMLMQDAGFRCAANEASTERAAVIPPSDQFHDVQSGWPQSRGAQSEYFYGYHPSDFYHLQVTVPNDCISIAHEASYSNVMVEAQMFVQTSRDPDGEFYQGLVLRAVDSAFYAFLVEPRLQRWRMEKHAPEGIALMDSGTAASISGTSQATADRLFIIADGPLLLFFVNGELVSKVNDATYSQGGIGLIAENESQSYSHIHFDAITAWEIEPGVEAGVAWPAENESVVSRPACRGAVRQDDLLGDFTVVTVEDSLVHLAEVLGISLEDFLAANSKTLEEIDTIKVGDQLIVPEATPSP